MEEHKSEKVNLENGETLIIDKQMIYLIYKLNEADIKTLACCCGHGIYPVTCIIDDEGIKRDLFSGIIINRSKGFYVKDKKGRLYLPEVSEEKK